MKINNPFERKEKRDFVPLSLFPASKTTKTSLQIGRATPVYTLDMMQGNKVKVDVSQLTRFATLTKPLMNDFEVNFGAYFVPYRALDDYFNSYYMMQKLEDFAADVPSINRCLLHADQFFDSSRPDSTRVHPISVGKSILEGAKMIGGLADHLGYRTYESDLLKCKYQPSAGGTKQTAEWYLEHSTQPSKLSPDPQSVIYSLPMEFTPVYSTKYGESFGAMPFIVWYLIRYGTESNYELLDDELVRIQTITNTYKGWDIDDTARFVSGLSTTDVANLNALGVIDVTLENVEKMQSNVDFHGNTIDNILGRWYNDLLSAFMLWGIYTPEGTETEANVIRYLSYMRIYSDWFLPENFCKADDFRDIIGYAYLRYITNQQTGLAEDSTLDNLFNSNVNPMYNIHSLKGYKFFEPYLRRGECLPVLWNKNYFNSMRSDLSINGENRTDFKYTGNGVADTPVGATIREHYFNRMFQRFKDLIARLGYDSRKNMAAIYGFKEDDKSLRSSVSLGTHTFDVQIADIAQTSESTKDGALGDFAGYAVSHSRGGAWEWTAGTNGVFMILAYIRPKGVSYLNQCDRSIFKKDYYDYLIPQFGGVGYQDIDGVEISSKLKGTKIGNAEIYWEYMMMNNECSGLMRTSCLDYHVDRDLSDINLTDGKNIAPLFITEKDKVNRIFNDTNEDTDPVLACMYFNGSVTRQLPEHIELDF